MNEVKLTLKEKLYNECKKESGWDDTYCFYYFMVSGTQPLCSSTSFEWCWNTDINVLMNCFKEFVMWKLAAEICSYDEYVTEDNSAVEILKIYANKFETPINNGKLARKLIKLLNKDLTNLDSITATLNEICDCVNELGVEVRFDFCKAIDLHDILMDHYGGELPIFNAVKEQLEHDSSC